MSETVQGKGPDSGQPLPGSGQETEDSGSFVTGLTDKSGETGAGQAPTKEPPKGTQEGTKATSSPPGFAAGLTSKLKADQKVQEYVSKFKNMDDAILAGMEAESKIGGMVSIPGKDAAPEERAAFLKKVGIDVPEGADGYDLEIDPSLKTDPDAVRQYQELAHDLGLTRDQARAFFARAQNEARVTQVEQRKERSAVEAALKREWGDDYQVQTENVRRAIRAYGEPELLKEIEETRIGNRPGFVRLLARIGSMTREDSAANSSVAGSRAKTIAEVMYPKTG